MSRRDRAHPAAGARPRTPQRVPARGAAAARYRTSCRAPARGRAARAMLLALAALTVPACRQDMHDQARADPYEASAVFADGMASRPAVAGTVPRGAPLDPVLTTGRGADGALVDTLPWPLDRARIARGRERFEIFCAPCHARTGEGDGIVVRRGFPAPPSLHEVRLRAAPLGHVFDVVTRGIGRMEPLASVVPIEDRWAIATWVRVLQTSRRVELAALSPAERARLPDPIGTGGNAR